jgi:hypothetical protein
MAITVSVDLQQNITALQGVADYAIQEWDVATLGECITIMNSITATQAELAAEAGAIAALPQPATPAPAVPVTTATD